MDLFEKEANLKYDIKRQCPTFKQSKLRLEVLKISFINNFKCVTAVALNQDSNY